MEYIYAALLLHHAGNKIDEASVKNVLSAAGVAADDSRVKALVAALEGVNIADAIAKAAIAPVALAPAAAHAAAPATAEATAPAHEEKKEDKKQEEESAMAGLGALFG